MEALLFLVLVGGAWFKFVWDTCPEIRVIVVHKKRK